MTDPEKPPLAEVPGRRRSLQEKHELVVDLVLLLFGGLIRLLERRRQGR